MRHCAAGASTSGGASSWPQSRTSSWCRRRGRQKPSSCRSGCSPLAPDSATPLYLHLVIWVSLTATSKQLTCHIFGASSRLLCIPSPQLLQCPCAATGRDVGAPHPASCVLGAGHAVLRLLQPVDKRAPFGPHVLCIPWSVSCNPSDTELYTAAAVWQGRRRYLCAGLLLPPHYSAAGICHQPDHI